MNIRPSDSSMNIAGVRSGKARVKSKMDKGRKTDTVSIGAGSEEQTPTKAELMEKSKPAKTPDSFEVHKKPYSDDEAKKAIQYFIDNGMENGTKSGFHRKILFFHFRVSSPDKVLDRLKKKKPVYIKNERNEYSRVDSKETLQVLDSLKGRGENTILAQDEFDALKFLEKGVDSDDGIYNPGFWGKTKVNSFDAYQVMRQGEIVEVNVGDKARLKVENLRNLAEANALYGQGKNTVLPQAQFDALKTLEKGKDENDGLYVDGERTNAYNALQNVKAGKTVGINIGKQANLIADDPQDLAEANVLYGGGHNTIMPDKDFQLFKYFDRGKDSNDGFYIEGNRSNAYEALQRFQDGKDVSLNIGDQEGLITGTPQDLAEADAFYGKGINTIMPDGDFQLFKYFDKGKDGNDGFYIDGRKSNAYQTLQRFQGGKNVSINIGSREGLKVWNAKDMQEVDAFYGSGKNTILPQEQYDSMVYFDGLDSYRTSGSGHGNAYQALQEMQGGRAARIQHNGISERAYTPEDIHELDSLEGTGSNTILPQDQFDNLQDIKPYLYNGNRPDDKKMSAYGALQKFQKGNSIDYRIVGGDFSRLVFGEVDRIENLPDGLSRIENQQEYDKYQFSVPEYKEKTEKVMKKTPKILEKEKNQSKSNIKNAGDDIQSGKSDKSDAERRIRRAKSDLSDAEYDLRRARSMPENVDEYGYHYGYNSSNGKYEYHYGRHSVHNDEKDRKMRRARSDISDAKRKLRRSKSKLEEAQRAIKKAQDELRTAQIRLAAGEDITKLLPGLQALVGSINVENFSSLKEQLRADISKLVDTATPCGKDMQKNIDDSSILLKVMETRPERPEGWIPPTPRME